MPPSTRLLAAVLVVAAVPAVVAASQPLIAGLQVVGDGISEPELVLEVLGLAVGDPLDRLRMREGVHALYAGGEVEYLRVHGRSSPEGVHLTVNLRLRSRITRMEIVGAGVLWRRRVGEWLELDPGGTVSAARVEVGVARALRKLREHGYADATVEPSLDFHRASNTVDLTVTVDLGQVQKVVAVRVEGLPDSSESEQVRPKVRKGKRLTRRLLGRVRDDAEEAARRLGYWEAQVSTVEQLAEGAEVTLVIHLSPGPRFQVRVDSPPDTAELVEEAIPDPAEEEVHPAQTDVLAERVRENLQLQGYLLADVDVELSTEEEEPVLTVRASPGEVLRISEVVFPGAELLAPRFLRRGLSVKPGRTRGWRGREVTDGSLERDRATLEQTYHRHGFADVEVASPILERQQGDAVRVSFPVDEGVRWLVEELRLEGFPVETVAALESEKLTIVQGGPWQPDRVDFVSRRLEAALANTGYPAGRVAADVTTPSVGRARVVLTASSGPYVSFGKVAIAGLKTTKKSVVESTLVRAGLEQGEPYSAGAIVIAQRLLYELGLFRRVEVVPLPGQEHRLERGLVVRCEEGRARSYLVGVGWDNEARFRLTLGWSHLNLFGGAHAVSVETRLSDREVRFQAGYREAWLPLIGMPGYAAVYRTEEDFATYSQLRRGLWFEVGDRRARPLRHWYRFEYQLVQPDAPDDVLSDLEREDQEIRLASLTPAFEWDARDDPLNPQQGIFTSASLEYAFPLLQAEAEFLRLQASFVVYRRLGRGSATIAVRGGAIEPLGPDTGEPVNLQIPLSKRFFAGGRVTHRAFPIDTLGIPGQTLDEDGNPIGGNGLMLLNLEYRRPIYGAIGAVVFLDGGNVWADYADMSFSEVRWGVGAGVHYRTPAGPLRLEYGHKLDRKEGESSGEVFLSFGAAF